MNDNPRHESYMIPGLQRGLKLLDLLAEAGRGLSLSEISSRMGLRRSSAYRVVYTLEHLGFIRRDDQRRYVLASKMLKIGFSFLRSIGIVEIARPHLQELRDITETSTHLGVRDGREVVYLSRYPSSSGVTTFLGAGDRAPAHATVIGQVLLAAIDDDAVRALYGDDVLATPTDKTPATVDELIGRLKAVRMDGYSIGFSNLHKGIAAVAAPIRDGQGDTVGAISITAIEAAIDARRFKTSTKNQVVRTAESISRELGWEPGTA